MAARLLHLVWSLVTVAVLVTGTPVHAANDLIESDSEESSFFRIGTSPVGESHFLIGGILANAISNPVGSRECAKGGSCGVAGLIAAAQSTGGSLDNLAGLQSGSLNAALVQANIALDAYQGTGLFKGKPPMTDLRVLAFLYDDSVQIITRREARIKTMAELKNRRIAVGEEKSDVFYTATALLKAAGIGPKNARFVTLPIDQALVALGQGDLDAVFAIDGYPMRSVALFNEKIAVSLVPVTETVWSAIQTTPPSFFPDQIVEGTYQGIDYSVESVRVGVYLMGTSAMSDTLACGIAQALYHPSTRSVLANAHWRGKAVFPDEVRDIPPIPPHAGLAGCLIENSTRRTTQ